MSHETNTIWLENQQERHEEINDQNDPEEEENQNRLNLEEAVLDEEEEEDVKHLAIEAGAYPDENI